MDEQPENEQSNQKKVRDSLNFNWHIICTVFFLFGVILMIAGGLSHMYQHTSKLQHALILAVGIFVIIVSLGVYIAKGIQYYKMWKQTTHPTFETFTGLSDESENKDPELSPDLEMNDQHLPSGILRLREEDGS